MAEDIAIDCRSSDEQDAGYREQGSSSCETATLTVSETGTVSLVPDTAYVKFGLESAGKSLAEAQKRNSTVMAKVMDRLRDFQIEKE